MADGARPLDEIDADLAQWERDLQHYADTAAALEGEADVARRLFDAAAGRWRPEVWRGKAAGRAHKAFDAHRHDANQLASRIESLAHEARRRVQLAQGYVDGLNLERQQAMQHG